MRWKTASVIFVVAILAAKLGFEESQAVQCSQSVTFFSDDDDEVVPAAEECHGEEDDRCAVVSLYPLGEDTGDLTGLASTVRACVALNRTTGHRAEAFVDCLTYDVRDAKYGAFRKHDCVCAGDGCNEVARCDCSERLECRFNKKLDCEP